MSGVRRPALVGGWLSPCRFVARTPRAVLYGDPSTCCGCGRLTILLALILGSLLLAGIAPLVS